METVQSDMVRVLVPHDSGFASGGMGPLLFPTNVLWMLLVALCVLLTPWTWWRRVHSRFIFPVQERRRIARGEAPSGHHYAEYPGTMTLGALIQKLGYDAQWIKDQGGELGKHLRAYGETALRDIQPETVTEAISDAQIASW